MSRRGGQVLECLYQHRLMSTRQLGRLLLPHAKDDSYLRKVLRALNAQHLIGAVSGPPPGRPQLWYATDTGAALVETGRTVPIRSYRMTETKADGVLQQHTLAVNDVGIAFVQAARRLGDDCGRLDWTPEVPHRLYDGARFEDALIADAVLNYVTARAGIRRQLTYFIELDRATMAVHRLAEKLVKYARLYHYIPGAAGPAQRGPAPRNMPPAWAQRYPSFPRILIVLSGANPDVLARRAADLRSRTEHMPHIKGLHGKVHAAVTTLDQLTHDGPTAPIAMPLLGESTAPIPLFEPARPEAVA